MLRVKICGITNLAEAQLVARCGADAIGFLVGQRHRSADFVAPDTAREILLKLPPFITPVLVTHFENPEEVLSIAEKIPCPVLQLHSDLTPAALKKMRDLLSPKKIIGKVSVQGESAVTRAREIEGVVDAIILDSIDPSTGRVGGTGLVHDWSLSSRIVATSKVPVILAGGLKPENVGEAVRRVRPWAVDVNSGVEDIDRRKDEERVRQFIESAKTQRQ